MHGSYLMFFEDYEECLVLEIQPSIPEHFTPVEPASTTL